MTAPLVYRPRYVEVYAAWSGNRAYGDRVGARLRDVRPASVPTRAGVPQLDGVLQTPRRAASRPGAVPTATR